MWAYEDACTAIGVPADPAAKRGRLLVKMVMFSSGGTAAYSWTEGERRIQQHALDSNWEQEERPPDADARWVGGARLGPPLRSIRLATTPRDVREAAAVLAEHAFPDDVEEEG